MKSVWVFIIGIMAIVLSCREIPAGEIRYEDLFTVEIPLLLRDDDVAKNAYIIEHFWDHVHFSDTMWNSRQEWLQSACIDFLRLLEKNLPNEKVKVEVVSLFQRVPGNLEWRDKMLLAIEESFRGPGRFHNEEFYALVCAAVLEKNLVKDEMRKRMNSFLEMHVKNRIGEVATDFTYTLASGEKRRMHDIEAEYLILFLGYDPGKSTSFMVPLTKMTHIYQFSGLIKKGVLKILFLYTDPDAQHWDDALGKVSDTWIRGYDAGGVLAEQRLYDLYGMPTLYLLDRDKRIIQKNVDWTCFMALLPRQP